MSDATLQTSGALRFDQASAPSATQAAPRATAKRGRPAIGRFPRWRQLQVWGRRGGAYLVAPLMATLAVVSWHTPGRFVAAGDVGPFVRNGLAGDVGSLWGYGLTGAGSATVEIARLPELGVYQATRLVGLSPELGQLGFYWLWLAGASAACIFLARQLVRSSPAHVAVGILALANPLMAVNLPNPLVPAALCTLALVGGALVRAAQGRGRVRLTVLATLPVSYTAINPPTLAVVVTALAAAAAVAVVAVPTVRRRLLRHLAGSVPIALLAHGWWIAPAFVVFAGGGGASIVAVTDAEAWSWTHVNNSVTNVATLTAHWGWGMHEYLPFSRGLDQLPMSPLRWALPALALLAPIVAATRSRRRGALAAIAVAAACIMVAKGLHAPGAWLNLELYRRVPGMWLLREPMSKLGPVLLLAYLVATTIAVDGIVHRARAAPRRHALAVFSALLLLVTSAAAFGHPVLTGAVAPHDRTPLPSSRVALPAGWWDVADAVNGDPLAGKALVLPALPFYQATTTWGFHGVATLPRDLFERPTLLGLPGGYFADDAVVSGLIDVVGNAAEPAAIGRALDALGVSHVIVRMDLSDAQAVRPVARPDRLVHRLAATQLFEAPQDHDVATVFRRNGPDRGPEVFTRAGRIVSSSGGGVARALTSLPAEVGAVTNDVPIDTSHIVLDNSGRRLETTVRVPTTGTYRVDAAAHVGAAAMVTRTAEGASVDGRIALEIDGRTVAASNPLTVPGPDRGPALALSVNGVPFVLPDGPVAFDLIPGTNLQALSEARPPSTVRSWSAVGDCNAVDGRDAQLEVTRRGPSLELSAERHTACVWAPTPVSGLALIRFEAQVGRGEAARACLWSERSGGCAWETTLPRAEGTWQSTAAVVDVPGDARLFLYADAAAGAATVRYRHVELVPLAAGPQVRADLAVPTTLTELTAGDHVLGLVQPLAARMSNARVGAPSPVSNCNARDRDANISSIVRGDAVRLAADRDAACVHYPVSSLQPSVPYDVQFEYRTVSGDTARWCLWIDGADRCANTTQTLQPSTTWRQHRDQLTIPDEASTSRLFVYADGQPGRNGATTITEYRKPLVRAAAQLTVSITDASQARTDSRSAQPAALLGPTSGSGDRWTLKVRSDGRPFLLALPDTANDGWVLDGAPAGITVDPTVIDGYRQGWVISGLDGDAPLVARYDPADQARLAQWASIAVVGAMLLPWRRLRGPFTGRIARARQGGRRWAYRDLRWHGSPPSP